MANILKQNTRNNLTVNKSTDKTSLSRLIKIENNCKKSPWTRKMLQQSLEADHVWTVKIDSSIIGFIIFSTVLDEMNILNICIDPEYQRQGHGQFLLQQVIDYARKQRLKNIYLEVRISNNRAIKLYHKLGFKNLSIRKNYYPTNDSREDAIVLAFQLT